MAQTLDLGDGKTQKIFERIKVEPSPEHRPPIKLAGPVGKITRCAAWPGIAGAVGGRAGDRWIRCVDESMPTPATFILPPTHDISTPHHPPTPKNSNLYFYASMNGVLEAVEKDFHAIETGLLSTKDWCVRAGRVPVCMHGG